MYTSAAARAAGAPPATTRCPSLRRSTSRAAPSRWTVMVPRQGARDREVGGVDLEGVVAGGVLAQEGQPGGSIGCGKAPLRIASDAAGRGLWEAGRWGRASAGVRPRRTPVPGTEALLAAGVAP